MNGSFIELVVFAAIAVVVGWRLYQTLGKRTGHEEPVRRRPAANGAGDNVVALPDRSAAKPQATEPSLAGGLTQVKLADSAFDRDQFVAGARAAFEMIVTAFAKGDLAEVSSLLSPAVHDSFVKAVAQRNAQGRTHETTLVAVDEVAIVEAAVERRIAHLTVRVVSRQVDVVRDAASGEVVEGDSRRADRVVDLWTFERDTRSRDPNWTLVATRSGE
jgi:predicted lipid-binding transport protein (Tim44 family)